MLAISRDQIMQLQQEQIQFLWRLYIMSLLSTCTAIRLHHSRYQWIRQYLVPVLHSFTGFATVVIVWASSPWGHRNWLLCLAGLSLGVITLIALITHTVQYETESQHQDPD